VEALQSKKGRRAENNGEVKSEKEVTSNTYKCNTRDTQNKIIHCKSRFSSHEKRD